MFNLLIQINNPFSKKQFKNLYCKHGSLIRHKAWEYQIMNTPDTLLELRLEWSMRRDHAGLNVTCGILGYTMCMLIYDTRHWDYNLHRWEIYEDSIC